MYQKANTSKAPVYRLKFVAKAAYPSGMLAFKDAVIPKIEPVAWRTFEPLDDDIFTRLTGSSSGTPLAASKYKFITSGTGFAAGDADDRIIYNTRTDKLYYDADGKGGAAAVQIAVITMAGSAHPVAGEVLIVR